MEFHKSHLFVFSPARLLTLNNSTSPSAALKIKQQGDVRHVCLECYVCLWELVFYCLDTVILFKCAGEYVNEDNFSHCDDFQIEFHWAKCVGHKRLLLSPLVVLESPPGPQTYLVGFCLYSAVPHKRFVNNSVPAITPTCTSHSDHLISLSHYVMLRNVKFPLFFVQSNFISASEPSFIFKLLSGPNRSPDRKNLPKLFKTLFLKLSH